MEKISVLSADESNNHDMEDRNTINVHIPNQRVQVQCLPTDHTGLIQSSNGTIQTIQVFQKDDSVDGARPSIWDYQKVRQEESDSEVDEKCRDVIDDGQRDSYGWILNDLSEGGQDVVTKTEDDSDGVSLQDANRSVARLQTMVPVSSIQMQNDAQNHGLQTLTMSHGNGNTAGATLVQYNGPDGQFFIPVSSISGSAVQAYQISSSSTLQQGVVSAVTSNAHQITEEASRKRELRLLKNSMYPGGIMRISADNQESRRARNAEAARECRRKKKDYVKCLENRVSALEDQNKKLIDELKILKGLYCAKD